MLINRSYKISKEQDKLVKEIAKREKRSESQIIRFAIEYYGKTVDKS